MTEYVWLGYVARSRDGRAIGPWYLERIIFVRAVTTRVHTDRREMQTVTKYKMILYAPDRIIFLR